MYSSLIGHFTNKKKNSLPSWIRIQKAFYRDSVLNGWLSYRLTYFLVPKYQVAFVGWPISGRLFVGEA